MVWIILTLTIIALLIAGLMFSLHQGRREISSLQPQNRLLQELRNGQDPAEVVPQLPDYFSVFGLEALAEAAAVRRQEIIDCLGHPSREVRVAAAELVSFLGWQEACQGLLPLLASRDTEEQLVAAEALARLGDGQVARRLLEQRDHYLPDRVAKVLVGLGKKTLPIIIEGLQGDDAELQCLLVDIAGEMKPERQELLPYLLNFLQNGSPALKLKSAEALGRLGAEAAVPQLVKTLEIGEIELRNKAVWALGMIRDADGGRALLKAREDAEPVVRAGAQQALESLGAPGDEWNVEN